MTVWITKYALSTGLVEIEAEPDGQYVSWRGKGYHQSAWGENKQWCRTHDAALTRADEMRKAKIASLHKQITKLEKMTFSK